MERRRAVHLPLTRKVLIKHERSCINATGFIDLESRFPKPSLNHA